MIIGDGMCGSYGEGPYKIIINDVLFKEGGEFGNSPWKEEKQLVKTNLYPIRLLLFYLD